MNARADLDTIRKALRVADEFDCGCDDPGNPQRCINIARFAALGRLAGCVILTREEAEQLRAGVEAHRKGRLDSSYYDNAALLDARLGAAAEETK